MVYNSQAITKTTFIKYDPFYETMHKSSFSLLIRGGVYFNTADSLLQVIFYFNNSSVKKNRIFAYSQFHKTLQITSSQIHWISVRFYEMGDIIKVESIRIVFVLWKEFPKQYKNHKIIYKVSLIFLNMFIRLK